VATATANASAVAEVKETASPEAPPSEISWRIVCYMYAVGFGISLVLGAIQVRKCHLNMGPIKSADWLNPAPTVTQLSGVAENLVGSWLIFMPFGPCLLYALTRHWQQARKEKAD
jgi:hypothetical protein